MVNSMTGFAASEGTFADTRFSWDIRSVNAKGLDIRMRLPDWIAGLDQAVRAHLTKTLGRGNVSVNLRLSREAGASDLAVDEDALNGILNALRLVEERAIQHRVTLHAPSSADILSMRGVLGSAQPQDEDQAPLLGALMADFATLTDAFCEMRRTEGQNLLFILQKQLDQIETLTAAAKEAADARRPQVAQTLRDNLARILDNAEGADADRVAQELALLAVKADVQEELDRLHAHVSAARELLSATGPVGRKLDFLMQEFNRETNTLCSKSQSTDLTRIGLELKAVIDQMREQVQNVE